MAREKYAIAQLAQMAHQFLQCQDMAHLSHLLGLRLSEVLEVGTGPVYEEFYIPKRRGGKRLIENPVSKLKRFQRKLNKYLQSVYFFHRTPAAYGFIGNPVDDPEPRHILSNAQRHIGCSWLLNVDMQNFFHLVSQERVELLFQAPLLDFPEDMARFLAEACCYKGRLPMGAPTSPVLTNLVCIPLDEDLLRWADQAGMTYTRYADDMSFSRRLPIGQPEIQAVTEWVEAYDLRVNPNKVFLYGPEHSQKEVTGLIVREDRVDVPVDYLEQLNGAVQKLSDIVDAQHLTPSGRDEPSPWVEELQDQIEGKLEFVRQIKGYMDTDYRQIKEALRQATEPPEQYGPLSWLDFGYSAPR